MKPMNKVVRLALICEHFDKDGNPVDYSDVYKLLWQLQAQTREIKNKTIQYCWEYSNFSSDYYKENHEYPKEKDVLNYTLGGFVNDKFKVGNDLYSANCSTTTQTVCAEFKNSKSEFLKGTKSIINYKSNQPLDLHNKSIRVEYKDNDFFVFLKLLNRHAFKRLGYKNTEICFKVIVRDKSTRTILERCVDQIYGISASKLIYNKKKKQWFLNLVYAFEPDNANNLDPNRILGVDLGIHYPICASVYGDLQRFTIHGGEIEEFRRRVESRKLSLLKQGKNCGDGRIGHGVKTRNKPVYSIEDRIARFRDTVNHKYSRALIDYAVKKECGTIQMEDLSGITAESDRFLKNWSYYDLQTKIEYKAKEKGIKIVYIDPKYSSQRCSKCGHIDKENRKTQSSFVCLKCGFEENADYNASQNIGIKDIDKIIESDLSSKCETDVN
ncbi:RNA-guided endonuclease TnpB family protein [Ruminococcus albus]|uniref:RNA-guided endonuclease TnpB family protein n=1 Tax=Ruminococcus albus TaxID=1264 RepID=UPI0004664109|nr:RNA-guided endonuclease TnpB family protein [Ruminococcus albus]